MTTEHFQTAENSITDYYHHNHFHKRTITDKRYHCCKVHTYYGTADADLYYHIAPIKGKIHPLCQKTSMAERRRTYWKKK